MKIVRRIVDVPDCTCQVCVDECKRRPGWFLPGEAEVAAAFLGLPLQEFFSTFLGVDWWVSKHDTFVLAPAVVDMEPGTMYPWWPVGQCVFLENDRCRIHQVKPYECRMAYHETLRVNGELTTCGGTRHESVANAWKLDVHQRQIKQLLEGESAVQWPSPLDALGVLCGR